jgi:hypothetical protein
MANLRSRNARQVRTYSNLTPRNTGVLPAVTTGEKAMIRKLKTGQYRLYSRKLNPKTGRRRNLGTFKTRAAAQKHEREIQFFKRR